MTKMRFDVQLNEGARDNSWKDVGTESPLGEERLNRMEYGRGVKF